MSPRLPADQVSVCYAGGTYIARFRGKVASATWSDMGAILAVVRKVLGEAPVDLVPLGEFRWRVVAKEAAA